MIEQLEGRRHLSAYAAAVLGTFPFFTSASSVAVNDLGQVVGTDSGNAPGLSAPFLYQDGKLIDFDGEEGTGPPKDINNLGQIIGSDNSGPYLYSDGKRISLTGSTSIGGGENVGTDFVTPEAINNNSEIVGFGINTFGTKTTDVGVLYANGTISELTSLTSPNGINDQNVIVGSDEFSMTAVELNGSALTNLGSLGGPPINAIAINDNNQIVGFSDTAAGDSHAFSYSGGTMTDLGTLGGSTSQANAINNSGQIVGDADNAAGVSHAFVDINGVMTDLNKLIPHTAGWVVTDAADINNSGQIAATETNAHGDTRAVLLSPTTGASTLRTEILLPGSASLPTGDSGFLKVRLTSTAGVALAGNIQITVDAATTQTVQGGEPTISSKSFHVGRLGAGQSRTFRLPYSLPQTLAGIYQLLASLSSSQTVEPVPQPVTIAAPNVDPAVSSTDTKGTAGPMIPISVVIINNGNILLSGKAEITIFADDVASGGVLTANATQVLNKPSIQFHLLPGRQRTLKFRLKKSAIPTNTTYLITTLTPAADLNDSIASDNVFSQVVTI